MAKKTQTPTKVESEAQRQLQAQKAAIEAAKQAGITDTFTQQDFDDAAKLDARAKNKSAATQTLKLSGEDAVIAKKLEEEKAKKLMEELYGTSSFTKF